MNNMEKKELADRKASGMQHQVQELQGLQALTQIFSRSADHSQVLAHSLEQLRQLIPYTTAVIVRRKETLLQLVASAGMENRQPVRTQSLVEGSPLADVLDSGSPLALEDAAALNIAGWPGIAATADTRAWLGVPLLVAGRTVGLLALAHTEPGRYGKVEIRRAQLLAQPIAMAVEQARQQLELERRVAELDALLETSTSLTTSLDLQQIMDAVVERSIKLLHGPKDAHVFLYEQGELRFGAAIWNGQRQSEPVSWPRKGGVTASVAESGEPLIIPDMRAHPIYANAPADWQGAIVALPLKSGDRVIGVMNFSFGEPHPLSQDELRLLTMLSNQAAIGIENARLYAQAQQDLAEQKRAEEERARLHAEIIQLQAQALAELSTPLFPITDTILVMPLIGTTDQQRAQRILETLLHGVERQRARVAIVDITGVPVIDTHVASILLAAAQAVRLLGAEVVLTGIRPEVAETLIGLGVDLRGIATYASLQSGVAYALRQN